ncbi:MAG: hypothetical protein DRI83_08095 [Bacteroidetes bacterium]|nr:MAG: hypothetical protein DRI83_08095 [Bacteroidota bacterium]
MKWLKFLILSFLAIFLLGFSTFAQMDTPPMPYGGSSWMKEFICTEMNYPEEAMEKKVEGNVVMLITVLQNGETTNYRILEGLTPELDAEALRICKLLLFYPAVKSSNHIIEDVKIPVKFNIKKYKRNCKQKGLDTYEAYAGPIDSSLAVYPTKALDQAPKPVFTDPKMDFGKFITENMKYPELAYTQNISGSVKLSFIVETSGHISNLVIDKPLGGGCTEEAIHLLKQVYWSPGILKGKAVRTFLSAGISFSLDSDSNHHYIPNNNNTTM